MKYIRTLLFIFTFTAVLLVIGHGLNPLAGGMFDFHDETQAARVLEFSANLRHAQIPPRIAPQFSFGMGYPVFNFYAPTAYWTTGLLTLSGLPVAAALKLSFLLAILVGFTGAYLLIKHYADEGSALLGAILYVTSLYVAVDVFVRGNLSEVWFIGLFPLTLYFLTDRQVFRNRWLFVLGCIIATATLGSHNLLSLLSIPILVAYSAVIGRLRTGLVIICLAIVANAYFLIPLFGESHLTYASDVAKSTQYADHFLCAGQLWQSPWGYGGSAPGCEADGISFKVGKPQLLFFAFGLMSIIAVLLRNRKKEQSGMYFFAILALASLFLTTYWSKPLWDAAAPLSAIIQFPWRFVGLSLIGISVVSAFGWHHIPQFRAKDMLAVVLGIVVLASVYKYFQKAELPPSEYSVRYESTDYILRKVAFKVSEYLPRTASYSQWKALDTDPLPIKYDFTYNGVAEATGSGSVGNEANDGFNKTVTLTKASKVKLNVHYMPYWHVSVNGKEITPSTFDTMGRPVLHAKAGDTIAARYRQTPMEVTGNIISLLAFASIAILALYTPLWKNISNSKA